MRIKPTVLLILIFFTRISGQENFLLHSPQKIKQFADFLFCDKDYLRAAEEYEKLFSISKVDSFLFLSSLAYSLSRNYNSAASGFSRISDLSLKPDAKFEFYKIKFIQEDFENFLSGEKDSDMKAEEQSLKRYLKLKGIFSLMHNETLNEEVILNTFQTDEVETIQKFFGFKKNPGIKSEVAAGLLSALIPGTGKIYTENFADGLMAFLSTGIFSYLSYSNFKAGHNFRGWLFAGLGGLFYAGNIYGSIASAQIFNAKLNIDFENSLKIFLEEKKYFSPDYGLCK
ncbi:MAG: hypothetical protein HXY49_09050 [Ignavibacteriaceae bacterium]|nr:hypothetical protein [Ignavibacteriaceae bacterium]